MEKPVDDEEIRDTIFSMKPLKAPGSDGLHAIFYQAQWEVVGKSVCKQIKAFFNGEIVPEDFLKILIVLIPKIDNPTSLNSFRPISLCTIMYKTITKIITNRLKTFLLNLVGPHQTSFVPGRHITENIIIAQEVIHSMRRKTGKRGFMAIKVDLEKTYDRLSWEFIEETLAFVGLLTNFIRIIMECITSGSMQILWNGKLTESFKTSRGICQGDPISPYIFVLCIERLSHIINREVQQERWKPIRLSMNGIPLTHLFFADDLLLLAEASSDQANVVIKALKNLCNMSGEKVSTNKTRLYLSKNVAPTVSKKISELSDFSTSKN